MLLCCPKRKTKKEVTSSMRTNEKRKTDLLRRVTLLLVAVVAVIMLASTGLYKLHGYHPQTRTVLYKPTEANPLAHDDDGVAPATTVEVERCGDATLAALGAANAVPWRKEHSRCPESSGYLEEHYMRKQLAARRRYSAATEAPPSTNTFLGLSIGCNKGYDAVNTLRMGSFNPALSTEKWAETLTNLKMNGAGVCGQRDTTQFGPLLFESAEAAARVVPSAELHCVEPLGSNFRVLENATRTLGYDRHGLRVHRAAVSNRVGEVSFPIGPPGKESLGISHCETRKCETVYVTTIDELVRTVVSDGNRDTPIDVLSIDTEGHDMEALLGATEVALPRTRYLEFEFHTVGVWKNYNLRDAIDLLAEHDFNCYWMLDADASPWDHPVLVRITECWLDQYNRRFWSNVACVNKKTNLELARRMEDLHQMFAYAAEVEHRNRTG